MEKLLKENEDMIIAERQIIDQEIKARSTESEGQVHDH